MNPCSPSNEWNCRAGLTLGLMTPVDVQAGGRALVGNAESEALHLSLSFGKYQLRLAKTIVDRDAACRLRFKVFNLELGEGLEDSYRTGLDQDHFDLFCDHLIVEDRSRGESRRHLSNAVRANGRCNLGYYSEREFDLRSLCRAFAEKCWNSAGPPLTGTTAPARS